MNQKVSRRAVRWAVFLALLAVGYVAGMPLYRAIRQHRVAADAPNGFLVSPYLQLGDAPRQGPTETAEVLWHTFEDDDGEPPWEVEVRPGFRSDWRPASVPPSFRRVALPGIVAHRVYRAGLSGLAPGEGFDYRVTRGGRTRFQARATPRPKLGEPSRTVILGDMGDGSAAEARVAFQAWRQNPDLLMLTGDLVYRRGRIGEYERNFFPFYNADVPSPSAGAPLLRSRFILAAPGNHDLLPNDLGDDPDAQAFFYYWSMPLNGPVVDPDAPGSPRVKGSAEQLRKFRDASGPNYPRMANFSADVGDVHWTGLDLNPYADWTDPTLLAWLEADLAAARSKPWRLVLAHQPGFQSGKSHCWEQQMRQLAPIFERGGVSIVFAGHVHNYQRSAPLTFVPRRRPTGKFTDELGRVEGDITVDEAYDGATQVVPRGVIYIVSGGGGGDLHDTERVDREFNENDFTVEFIADRHSFTVMDATPDELRIRQLSDTGEPLDSFVVRRDRPQLSDAGRPLDTHASARQSEGSNP